MVLIKNSTVVDGTGAAPVRKDILIKENRIAAIGNFPNKEAAVVIDAQGMITCPGFIDVNTDSDHYLSLFTDPAQQDFLLQGVTTIIGGHCGSSLAPLLRGSLDSVRKWAADTNQINVNWYTFAEFLSAVKSLKLGVNFGSLVGHATIRRAILGEQLRDLTEGELKAAARLIEGALEQGALGLSTGLGYNHSHNVSYLEIKRFTDLVHNFGGIYTTHLRNEKEKLLEAVEETLLITEQSQVKTIISHFRPIIGYEEVYQEALKKIAQSSAEIYFDLYPFVYSILPIYLFLPEAHRCGSLETMMDNLEVHHVKEDIKKSLGKISGRSLRIARAQGFDYLVGKTLDTFSKERQITAADALLELMRITKLKAVLFYDNVSEQVGINALMSDRALLASNSPSLVAGKNVLENERGANSFKKFLAIAKKEKKPIEWTIQKLTQKPAQIFNLKERGTLEEGAIADIAVLAGERASHVFVNGIQAVKDSQLTNGSSGSVLTRV